MARSISWGRESYNQNDVAQGRSSHKRPALQVLTGETGSLALDLGLYPIIVLRTDPKHPTGHARRFYDSRRDHLRFTLRTQLDEYGAAVLAETRSGCLAEFSSSHWLPP